MNFAAFAVLKAGALLSAAFAVLLYAPAFAADAPYAGQQARAIKALSDDDVAALRKGEGMGLAKAAELNGYPGPSHVLELAAPLALSDAQRRGVEAVFGRMNAAAKRFGRELVAREEALDQGFARGEMTRDRLSAATASIAVLRGRLRAVHLSAHLETRALLNAAQIARYQELRGYADPHAPAEHRHHPG